MTRRALSRLSGAVALIATAAATLIALVGGLAAQNGAVEGQRSEVRALEAELLSVEGQAAAAAQAHAEAVARAEQLEADIAENTRRLKQARRDLAVSQRRLADRLVTLYAEAPPDFIEVLLTSGDLTDAVQAHDALETIGRSDQRVLRNVRSSRTRLRTARTELLASRDEVKEARVAAAAEAQRLDGLLAQRRAVLSQARARLQTLQVAEQQRRAQAQAIASAQREGEAAIRGQAAGDPGSAGGAPAGPAPQGDVASHLARIAQCESGGNPGAVSASGQYRGKYQFDQQTWERMGGSGDPASAPEAEQDARAAALYNASGPGPWPVCGRL